MNFVAVIFLL